jgi:selenide, water dikinase
LPVSGIAQVVRNLPKFSDPDLIVGADGASDAGVYRLRDDLLIAQTVDFFPPLVDDPFVFGQIAAANSLSDVYAMGGDPKTVLNVVGFPDDQLDLDVLNEILRGGAERVVEAGAVILGGHTVRDVEIKYGMSVTGLLTPEQLITNRDAKPGDSLVLTKPLGTGFITTAFKAGRCPDATLAAAVASMTQLNVIGRDAARKAGAKAATDITGFGLAVHAAEMAQASDVTVVLEPSRFPAIDGAAEMVNKGFKTRASASNREFADTLMTIEGQADPLQLDLAFDAQTSGGLLISVDSDKADQLVEDAREAGAHSACIVGNVVEKQSTSLVLRSP